jgi:adenosylcobinamide kinase / adenosylcobinamide-phosphate guanylyltransferase
VTTYRRILVLGGARSGKSRFAQALAERSSLRRVFVATGQAFDDEMRERIARHREERSANWETCEEPLALAEIVRAKTGEDAVVLVDCLTLWLSNILLAEYDVEGEIAVLSRAVEAALGPLILVSNEVGHGIVPGTPLGRAFRDAQGRLNQAMAAICDGVVLVTAGCPTLVKPAPDLKLRLA